MASFTYSDAPERPSGVLWAAITAFCSSLPLANGLATARAGVSRR